MKFAKRNQTGFDIVTISEMILEGDKHTYLSSEFEVEEPD